MSEVELFVRHEAEIDALTYFDYIRQRNPDAALRFLAAIDSTVEALAKQPLMGRPGVFEAKIWPTFVPGESMILKLI